MSLNRETMKDLAAVAIACLMGYAVGSAISFFAFGVAWPFVVPR